MAEPQLVKILNEYSEMPNITYNIKNEIVDFKGKINENYSDNREPLWDKLLEQYKENVKIKNWKEKTVSIINPFDLLNNKKIHLEGASIDTYSIDAFRSGFWGKDMNMEEFPFYNLVVIGALKTKDNKLVIGKRSGKEEWAFAPGGHVTFKEKYEKNPLEDAILGEAQEETGNNFEYKNIKPLGVFAMEKAGFKGIKFLMGLETDAEFEDIKRMHASALDIYNKSKDGKKENEMKARQALKEASIIGIPADAWEHTELLGLDYNKNSIESFFKEKEKEGTLMSVAVGGYPILLNTLG